MLHSILESNICFILRIEIRKVAKILRTDSLEDENCKKLFTITAFYAARGKTFFPDFMDRNMERDACTLEPKGLFCSEDDLSLKVVHRYLKSLIYFDV